MKNLLYLVIITLATTLSAQTGNIISKVGDYNITKNELVTRFEMTPQIGAYVGQENKGRLNNLLYTLIAEKLWAQEARGLGLDTTAAMRNAFRTIEKLHAKDVLWKEEIKSNLKITNEDYQIAYERSRAELDLNYLYSETQDEILELYKQLGSNVPFDSLLNRRPEKEDQKEAFIINYNQMPADIENDLFSLKANEYSDPIKSPMGWFIFKLIEKKYIPIQNEKQLQALNKEVKDVVEQRAIDKLANEFVGNLFKDKSVKTNGYLFNTFAKVVISELEKNQKEKNLKPEDQNDLTNENFYNIIDKIDSDSLNMIFIEFEKDPITLNQFIDEFQFEGFFTKTLDHKTLFAKLYSRVKSFIEGELLAREAIKRGLHKLPEIQEELNMWKTNYLSNALRQQFVRETFYSKEDTKKHYDENKSDVILPQMVNIIEIFTKNLDNVQIVLDELQKGTSFKELAKKYNERQSTKDSNGDHGFFTITEKGELGKLASEMNEGDVYGPLEIDGGWSIFKLIEKKDQIKSINEPYEKVKDDLRKKLSLDKYNKTIVERTIKMAGRYGVTINEDLLNQIEPINMNMVVYRYYGFGGRTLAVPLNVPFTSWFKPWKEGIKYLP